MTQFIARRLSRLHRDDQGANLVEAAIILPLMLLLIATVIEFAAILYVQMALQNGVSQATRYSITRGVLPNRTREQSIKAVLKQETPTLSVDDARITFSHKPLTGGSWTSGTGAPNTIERVKVTYDWPIMTPVLRPMFSSSTITIEVEATMKNESELSL